jgi:glycosyltransferase involved in cell wall biosynthesis
MIRTVAVIPAHNEEATVADVVARTRRQVDHVIVVDDGSRDATAERAHVAGGELLRLTPNRGKGAALRAGLVRALALGAERVITLDADGEHEPEEIPHFLAALDSADVVLGTRQLYRSGMRRVLNGVARFWFQLLAPQIEDADCGFRGFRAAALPKLESKAGGFSYEHEVILLAVAAGLRLANVQVSTNPRAFSNVTSVDVVRSNNHFDRWVLSNLQELPLARWRKGLLAVGCVTGLALGVPTEWVLRARKT